MESSQSFVSWWASSLVKGLKEQKGEWGRRNEWVLIEQPMFYSRSGGGGGGGARYNNTRPPLSLPELIFKFSFINW